MAKGGLVAKVRFIGDASDLLKATKRIESNVSGLSRRFKRLGSFAKVAIGAFAVTRVVGFLKQSVRAADDAAKAQRRLDAVFTASGAKSLKLFKDLNAQAREISIAFGIDNGEVVKVQERLSAYLEAFASQGAEGAEKFKAVTKLAFDIDAAGLASAEAAAKTLGQVLLEPLTAANRLKKLGIQLTNDEIDSIKELVAQGRIAEAQNVILQALARQVGGVAEANSSALDRLNAAVKDIVGSIGIIFLPLLEPLADALAWVAEKVQKWTDANKDFAVNLKSDVVGAIKNGWSQIKNWAQETGLAEGATRLFKEILISLGFTADDTASSIDGLTDSTKDYGAAVSEIDLVEEKAVKRKLAFYEITESLKNIFKNLTTAIGDAAGTIAGALFTAFAQFKSSKIVAFFINQVTDLINIMEALSITLGGLIRQLGNFVSLLAAVLTGNIAEAKKVFDRIVADAEDTVNKLNVLLGRARQIAAAMTGSNTVPSMNLPFGGGSVIPKSSSGSSGSSSGNSGSSSGGSKSGSSGNGKTVVKELPTKTPTIIQPVPFDVGSFRMAENKDLLNEQKKQTEELIAISDAIEKQRVSNAASYTVNVQTLQPTAQVGQLVVDAIKQFQDRSGGGAYRGAIAL